MEPYPTEMRKRILADCDAGMGTQAVALKYLVSESWVRRLKQRRRETGEISARKLGSRRQPKWLPHAKRILETVEEHPDATLAELRQYLDLDISVPTLARALHALRITFKKKCFMPKSRSARTLRRSVSNGRPR
jgi:transposase